MMNMQRLSKKDQPIKWPTNNHGTCHIAFQVTSLHQQGPKDSAFHQKRFLEYISDEKLVNTPR